MNKSPSEHSEAPEADIDRTHNAHSFQRPYPPILPGLSKPHHPNLSTTSHSSYNQQTHSFSHHRASTANPTPMHQISQPAGQLQPQYLPHQLHAHHQHVPQQQQQQHQQQQQQLQHYHQQQSLHQQASDHRPPLQRGTSQGFSVPRTISTPAWTSSAHHTAYSTSSNIGASGPPPPSSSSSSGSLLSYWDQSATSDSEVALASGIPASDQQHTLSEVGGSHHRYTSSAASLPAISPTGMMGHPSTSYLASSANLHGQSTTAAGPEHYHPYRPSSMHSMGSSVSTQNSYHSSNQAATNNAVPHSASVSAPLASPGFVYSPSGSSAPLGPGAGYESYPPSFASHSQYVSYLPPALPHDPRFYPLNPFEIKHRRRTTKTQFRVLESTFREVPKPNAALRKQISAQLDMPLRAVQIWFQNRRAKAKAMEKKRQPAECRRETSQERQRASSSVASHHLCSDAGERRNQVSDAAAYPASQFQEVNRPLSRSMDLPPLRTQADATRQDTYAATHSGMTLPSINVDPGPLRDRRCIVSAPVTLSGGGNTSTSPLGLSYTTSLPAESQEQADGFGSVRAPGAGLDHLQPLSMDASHASQSNSSLSAGMQSGMDRPTRMATLSPHPAVPREAMMPHGSSPRPLAHDTPRLWSAPQQ